MKTADVFKVLANPTRLSILHWLKEPEKHFPSQDASSRHMGICVGLIQKKAGLAQSTVSHYLSMLESAGFVISTRCGQWTYYRRNEQAFVELAKFIETEI
ncbi:MAG: metalloregulator ArsR/SmtB family transcription factor [Cyanobacteriota bacterium]|nr:metalloregulator ArsR/SmtB family transcription factor [Cyanobacteriota bacterium]